MLNKAKQLRKNKNDGFTIIEVLIVLAIAGLILLVVFLAVPALNRNSHNNQYKTEASNILSAYQETASNNSGGVLSASASSTGGSTDADKVLAAANTKTLTKVTIQAGTAGSTATGGSTSAVVIATGVKCQAQNSNKAAAGSTRNYALFYQIESTGSTTTDQCIDS